MRALNFTSFKLINLLLIIGFLITGCGFKLRTAPNLPADFKVMALQTSNPYGSLAQQLQRILPALGVELVPLTANPPLVLAIDSDVFTSIATVESASSSTQQYVMNYVVVYHLANPKGQTVYGPKTLKLSAPYSVNQNQVLSTDQVQQNIQQQLQQEAVYQLVTQLSSPDAQAAVTGKKQTTAQ